MSKKLKNKLVFAPILSVFSISSLFFLSSASTFSPPAVEFQQTAPAPSSPSQPPAIQPANPGQNPGPNSGGQAQPGTSEKKAEPITEEDLRQNKAYWEAQKESLIDQFIDKVDEDIKIKLADIASKTRDNLEEKLQQSFFWIQLRDYFKRNREGLKKNPSEFGLNIISPFAFANNLKLKRGDVSFDKENYQGLEWGTNNDDNYEKINNVKTSKVTEVPNTLKGKEFENRIKTYFQGLTSQYKQYLFKEEEFPVYKKNFNLDKFADKSDTEENLLLASKPIGKEGITSWNDWIKNYFEKQSLLLDFTLNQLPNPSSSQSAQEQINFAIKKITNQNPPDVAEKPEFEVRIAPDLPPIIAPQYATMTPQQVVNLYNSASQEEKNNIFFFLNPLNSRFKYFIESVSFDAAGNKINAKVKIVDFVNQVRDPADKSKAEKVYDTPHYTDFPEGATPAQKQAITTNLYHSNLGVTAVIDQFFSTLNIQDQFSFDQIRYYSPGSQTTIYNFFYLLTKVFYNQDFLDAQKKLAQDYINSSHASVFSASQFQFLSYLKKSEIDNNKAWSHYYLIYFLNLIVLQDKFFQYLAKPNAVDKEAAAQKEKQFDETLKKLNLTREDINRYFAQAHEKVALFHNESYKLSSNLVNQFLAMTKLGRQINLLNQILGHVAYFDEPQTNQGSSSINNNQQNSDPIQNFSALIEKFNNEQQGQWLSNNLAYIIVGTLSVILVSIAVISRLLVYKRNQLKKVENNSENQQQGEK
ncbi:MSC_0620 family F1-like ATPase-associated subunit [Mesomycoplasma ovipneumoniae]|uniref:MSC_0620 family F1-like ATPase-associated subunit n=1 Tax=Mesomycoplasma ovipneumoniae TaxID=29562 RepID=UPI00311ACA6D